MDEPRPTVSQLKALRVVDLRQRLSSLGLSQSGIKADLVARLDEFYGRQEAEMAKDDQVDAGNEAENQAEPEESQLQQEEADRQEQEMIEKKGQAEDQEKLARQQEEEERRCKQEEEANLRRKQEQEEEELRQQKEAEEERHRQEEEELKRKQEAGVERHRQEEEALRRQQEAEEQKRKHEAEGLRRQQEQEEERGRQEEEELRRQQEAEEERRRQEEEALRRQQEAEEERRRQEEEEERRRQEEEELKRKQEAEEQKRKHEAEELRRQQIAEEQKRKHEAEELKRQQIAEEQRRKHEEEELRRQQEEEELRRKQDEDEQMRVREQEELKQSKEDATREQETEAAMEIDEAPKRPLFKARITPRHQLPNMPGPPPSSEDLEMSPQKAKSQEAEPEPQQEEKVVEDRPESASPDDLEAEDKEMQDEIEEADANDDEVVEVTKGPSGGSKGKKKKKKKKKNRPEEWARQAAEAERRRQEEAAKEAEGATINDIEVEYIQEKLDLDPSDPMYRQFARIFEVFKIAEDAEEKADRGVVKAEPVNQELKKVPKLLEADDMIEEREDEEEDKQKLSKRKMKKLNRLSVAELKQLVSRPDVVEMHDVTAKDPGLLVHLKSTRNTVPVPRHWCFKRKYLQGKRGIEKPPFDLPDFIKKTGIMEMRAALQEKEEAKNMKSKMREKVRPKLGKIDIDYQKLHDAFFKWQTKPRMTFHGDLYYEGKEFEIRLKEKKPGDLTDDLRTALGMPVGPNAHKVPPPWLISMQRYGPPPSYPNLKVPGLNAPIPDGCSFGYHAGGWGKPPVDETGKPLYGDVFGTSDSGFNQHVPVEEVDQSLWGEMESESEEEESEEEEGDEDEEEGNEAEAAGMQTPIVDQGLATPSGLSSVGGPGQETPELIELRKRKIEADMESGADTPNLYAVLPERRNERIGASMMGSTHTYDLPPPPSGVPLPPSGRRFDTAGGVEMALNPEEVDLMDTDAMQAKAEAALREQQASLAKEDLSDMVAEHAAKQSSKRKRLAGKEEAKSAKKYKDFKF